MQGQKYKRPGLLSQVRAFRRNRNDHEGYIATLPDCKPLLA